MVGKHAPHRVVGPGFGACRITGTSAAINTVGHGYGVSVAPPPVSENPNAAGRNEGLEKRPVLYVLLAESE